MPFLWGVIPAGHVATLRPGPQSVQWGPRHTPGVPHGEMVGHARHRAPVVPAGKWGEAGDVVTSRAHGTRARSDRRRAWLACWVEQHLQAGEQARRAGAPRGQQLWREPSEGGRGLAEGRQEAGLAGTLQAGAQEGWQEPRGQALSCLLGLWGRGAGSRAGALGGVRGNPRGGSGIFGGFPVAEHQPGGRVGADAVRTCPPAAWE